MGKTAIRRFLALIGAGCLGLTGLSVGAAEGKAPDPV